MFQNAAINSVNEIMALKYVDDLTLVENTQVTGCSVMQAELDRFGRWVNVNNMTLNVSKCLSMDITFARSPSECTALQLAGHELTSVDVLKILGIKITKDLKWDTHITDITRKASGRLFMLTTLRRFGLKIEDLIKIYIGYIRPLLEYAVPVWHPGLTVQQHNSLERIQKRACKIIMGTKYSSYHQALQTRGIQALQERREHQCLKFAQSLMKSDVFRSWLPNQRGTESGRSLRNSHLLTLPRARTQRYANSVIPYLVKVLNECGR